MEHLRRNHVEELRSKDEIIRVIEAQMESDSKKYGAEVAELKVKLMEAEIKSFGLSDS